MVKEEPEVLANVPLDVRWSVDLLYKVLCTKFDPSQVNNNDNTFSSHSSGWDEDHDEEYNTLWPTPLTTPFEGDDMHPPQPQISGPHPGQDWAPNTQETTHYYRFLIPDSTTRCSIVAPFLSYSINRSKPEVSSIYGEGYPIYTRPLTNAQVDDKCPAITTKQQGLLNPDASFANAINHVINNFFPYDFTATVHRYQYFMETQYAIQASIHHLQEKEMRYLEHAVGTLSELENANVLGHLLAHDGDIVKHLIANSTPSTYLTYAKLSNSFKGQVIQSTLDTHILQCSHTVRNIISLPLSASQCFKQCEKEKKEHLDEIKEKFHAHLHTCPTTIRTPRTNIPLHVHACKQCHRCKTWGHIRATCPKRPYGHTAREAAHCK